MIQEQIHGGITNGGLRPALRDVQATEIDQLAIRSELMALITRFGSRMGLKPHLKEHLLWLIGRTFAQDWSDEAPYGPVVYASVRNTAQHFGITERALWKREQELIRLGLIRLQTTNDNKRRGQRDESPLEL